MARLLIVDDDTAQLQVWKLLLEACGHEIITAETAGEALQKLIENRPDVLLTDLRLPKLRDGLSLIRSVAEQRLPARIIVLSGWPEELSDWPEEKLVSRVYGKPVKCDVLLRAIRELTVPGLQA